MKIAVPDLISNSYFPAVAAVELGCFRDEGIDAQIELIFPVDKSYEALRDGAVDLVAGSAHSAAAAFPNWRGARLLCAQAQGMYWFLVMHRDFKIAKGDVAGARGRTIGAAPWVRFGLQRLLAEAGIAPVEIAPVPAVPGAASVNFGLNAARALEARQIDGFWANGMGAAVAVSRGVGDIVLDIRRGDGPKGCFDYTFASIVASEQMIAREPAKAAAAVRAIVRAQAMLREDVSRAVTVASKVFPASEAALIEPLIARDLPYYSAAISRDTVAGLSAFSLAEGITSAPLVYEDVVATEFSALWGAP